MDRIVNECVPVHAVYCANIYADKVECDEVYAQALAYADFEARCVNHPVDRIGLNHLDPDQFAAHIKKRTEADVMYASGIVSQPVSLSLDSLRGIAFKIETLNENSSRTPEFDRVLIQPIELV